MSKRSENQQEREREMMKDEGIYLLECARFIMVFHNNMLVIILNKTYTKYNNIFYRQYH